MGKKIIRDVIIKKRKEKAELFKKEYGFVESSTGGRSVKNNSGSKKRRLKFIFVASIVVAVVFVGRFALNNFSYSVIKITPRQDSVKINLDMTAYRDNQRNGLSFEVMQLEENMSLQTKATGISGSGERANGKIVIFNTYSASGQRLVNNTRFESSDGRIYRIKKSVTVPGYGSVEAVVYADQPGPDYNSGLTDFTIPGLKGGLRFEKIYARSKSEIRGGSNPKSKIITERDLVSVRSKLKEKLKTILFRRAKEQKPEGYVLYEDAILLNYSDVSGNPVVGETSDTFTFKLKGEATVFLFKKELLVKELSREYLETEKMVDISNIDNINFTLTSSNADNNKIQFKIKGTPHFVWLFNEGELVDKLMEEKKDYTEVFKEYPDIDKAEIIFRPGWWHFLPKRKSHILIEKNIF